jgi:hypothetical protein
MNDANHPTTDEKRFSRLRRVVWLGAWVVAGLLLLVGGTDTSKTHFLLWPVWLALAP